MISEIITCDLAWRDFPALTPPPWRQPRGKWTVSLVNFHTNASSKRWHLWEIDLGFALSSTAGWVRCHLRQYPKIGRYAAQIFGYWKEGQYDIKWADPQGMAPTQVNIS